MKNGSSNQIQEIRLNLGGGTTHLPYYRNVDASNGQSAYPLDYPDNAAETIRASHILEHFGYKQTLDVLKEWVRVLKPGGWLKVAVPDFRFIADAYLNKKSSTLPLASYLMGGQQDEHDHHKAVFDKASLSDLMTQAGLVDLQPWESEIRDSATLDVSLNLMGRKPLPVVERPEWLEIRQRDKELLAELGGEWYTTAIVTGPFLEPEAVRTCKHGVARVYESMEFAGRIGHCPCCGNAYGTLNMDDEMCDQCKVPDRVIGYKSDIYQINDTAPVEPRFVAFNQSIRPWNKYSQFCEESVVDAIFQRIGIENKWCFEAGAADGLFLSNTQYFIEQGWSALLIESDPNMYGKLSGRHPAGGVVKTACVTVGTEWGLDHILDGWGVPLDIDLLSLDIDGQEYHVLNAMVQYRPRVLVIEYDPDVDPMFIPEPNGEGQAGRLAMIYACQARGYEVICRTQVNLICVRKDLAHLLEQSSKPEEKRFIEGRWVSESEGVIKEKVKPSCAVVTSTPRIGFLDCADILWSVSMQGAGVVPARAGGVSWHQALSRGIKAVLDYDGEPFQLICTLDYDTFASPADLQELIKLAYQNPQYDAFVPVQAKRDKYQEILARTAGAVNLTEALVPITSGHFGLTVFRRRVFEQLPKPWFLDTPDENGDWGEGRFDSDIWFWQKFCDRGFRAALATKVVIGHSEECVSYPRIENGVVTKVYQPVSEYMQTRKAPDGVGVIL